VNATTAREADERLAHKTALEERTVAALEAIAEALTTMASVMSAQPETEVVIADGRRR
jgi:putative heme iron utilization protein